MQSPNLRTEVSAFFALALASAPAAAQDYPTRSITLIVPFAAGGPTDVVARIVGEHMSKTLGQSIVPPRRLRRGAPATTAPRNGC